MWFRSVVQKHLARQHHHVVRKATRVSAASSRPFSKKSAAAKDDEAPIEIDIPVPFETHKLDEFPDQKVMTTKKEIVGFFRDLFRMRRMEIAADVLYKGKFIRGFCHLYDGQEAVCVGMESSINYEDAIITSYRDHCTYLGRGGNMYEVIAELLGRRDGCSNGIGGSMHMYNRKNNFYGGNGIVGAQVPLGVGIAFQQKYNKKPNCTFAMYGDGAANQGQGFEALNMAALWDLPIVYVCENNHYGMGTAEARGSKQPCFFKRGDYVPGIKVDGMDVFSVKKAIAFAKDFVIKNGPLVMEMDTYRYHGHSMSDPGSTYRTRDEISGIRRERDPIERVRKLIQEMELLTPAEMKAIEKEARSEVDAAIEKAKACPEPPHDWLTRNIYQDKPEGWSVRGVERGTMHPA
jgi:pyruvate dehydrogenase E1 component alpha subunit